MFYGWLSDDDGLFQDVPHAMQRTTLKATPLPHTIPRYHTLKPTTFVLEPIIGKWKPPHINAVAEDSLRILDDENLFKEFLSTMFGSQEAKEYEELFANATEETKLIKRQKKTRPQKGRAKKIRKKEKITEFATKNFEVTTQPNTFTALDSNIYVDLKESSKEASDDDDEVEKNILKLIENIEISDKEPEKEIEKEMTDISENDALELILNEENNMPGDDKLKNVDKSLLTLLYLSDSEKKSNIEALSNVIADFDEHVDEGLSIAIDGFKDMTFRNNDTVSFYNYLPKEEMYEMLAEAIDDVAKNKKK